MKYYKCNENGEVEGIAINRKFISRNEAEEIFPNQPERSKREDCEKGIHSTTNPTKQYEDGFDCDCGAKIRRCGALNTAVTS